MTNEEAKAVLELHKKHVSDPSKLREAIDIAIAALSETNDEWVSVEAEHPLVYGTYLIMDDDGCMDVAIYLLSERRISGDIYKWEDNKGNTLYATHYKQLPSPPNQ